MPAGLDVDGSAAAAPYTRRARARLVLGAVAILAAVVAPLGGAPARAQSSDPAAAVTTATDGIDLTAPAASGATVDAPPGGSSGASSSGLDEESTKSTTTDATQSTTTNGTQATTTNQTETATTAATATGGDTGAASGGSRQRGTTAVPPRQAPSLEPADDLAAQTAHAKRIERRRSCGAHNLAAAFMPRVRAELLPYDTGGSWTAFAVALGIVAALLLVAAVVLKRRAAAGDREPPAAKGMLETAAMVVAICGGVAALAAQFIPGVGVHTRPVPEADMAVRKVDARITRQAYAHAVHARTRPRKIDRNELGNVVWVELRLRGYEGRPMSLDYGPYVDHALVGEPKHWIGIPAPETDDETTIIPIWIPYPSDQKVFQAQFRLLDSRGVRAIAGTGDMRGPRYRYACARRA